MNKQYFFHLLMAMLLLGLSQGVLSCKDDDDDDVKETPDNITGDPTNSDEAQTAWRWLCALTDAQQLTDDWASQTYEPTVGVASEQNANTRLVTVADIDEARQSFASMADVETSRLTSEYTASQQGVGTLTWTPSAEGAQNLAEVTVDTKLIPHLQRIVYCTKEQTGKNGLFSENVDGTAYYRFGDVVRDGEGYYWVCVRPSFWENDKGDSHWINIFNSDATSKDIPAQNIYDKYNKAAQYGGRTILLPTGLKYSREHMNNLANFIWALLDRDAYASAVNYSGEKNALGGFSYTYHGARFLKNVSHFWSGSNQAGYTVWRLLFNRTYEEMLKMTEMTFLYKGYQWRIGNTGYVWEFTTKKSDGFQKSAPGSESKDKKLYDFGGKGYDINRYTSHPKAAQNTDGPAQFGDNGHYYWVVRYKKGSELMARGKYSPYEKLNGCDDIYRYNEKTNAEVHNDVLTDNKVEVVSPVTNKLAHQITTDYRADSHYHVGDIYTDENGDRWIAIYPSGQDAANRVHAALVTKEPTPFTELVCFDGLKVSADKSCVTNLPTRDQAIRGNQWLYHFYSSCFGYNLDNPFKLPMQVTKHIKDNAGVDITHFYQSVASRSGDKRNHTQQAAFAYSVPGITNRQPLMRFLLPIDIDNQAVPYVFREHYVENPNNTAIQYNADQFGQELICLQDVADQEKVNKYAADFYACQPITVDTGGDGTSKRTGRTKADERANNVANYIYNKEVWDKFEYPTDMWNEPVIFFRMDCIYDRGDTEYATTTVGGHTLTLTSACQEFVEDENDPDELNENKSSMYSTFNTILVNYTKDTNHLDGKVMHFPSWKEAWGIK